MNTVQRKFLTDKITEKTKKKIQELENKKLSVPSINLHVFHAVMSGKFDIRPIEELKEIVRQKALKVTERNKEDWLGNEWGRRKDGIALTIEEFFILPDEYQKQTEEAEIHNLKIQEEINSLNQQMETLILRINLASDKTLQKMINEVDDMGDLSLLDTKIRLLN